MCVCDLYVFVITHFRFFQHISATAFASARSEAEQPLIRSANTTTNRAFLPHFGYLVTG